MTKNVKAVGGRSNSNVNMKEERVPSASDVGSCISSVGGTAGGDSVNGSDFDLCVYEYGSTPQSFPFYQSPPLYYGYYYLGSDGSLGGVDDKGQYVVSDRNGADHQYLDMQGDNGSLVYMMPGFQPSYSAYSPYVLPSIGVDGQYIGQQPLSPIPLIQQSITSPEGQYIAPTLTYEEMGMYPYMWDPSVYVGDGAYANGYSEVIEIPSSKVSKSTASGPLLSKGSIPTFNESAGHGARKQSKMTSKGSQNASTFQADACEKGSLPHAKFPLYNQGKAEPLYPIYPENLKKTRGWSDSEKLKSGKMNIINDFDLPNKQNYGPRTENAKGSLMSGSSAEDSLSTDGIRSSNITSSVIRREHYNLANFPTRYDHALFFVIKSYSEDDIHRSIKYNVWASTTNGNKRLDGAYQEAQEKAAEKGSKCPVFLFFSVNASGQFCGVAEMVGRVDFNKSMDFWQQDKWNGYFPVKWHIIKDIPNPQLRHIILENNDNKPVTNSRDTQEVRFQQGMEILNILKNYVAKTSILDDFDFYESRQKVMQDKRIRSSKHQVDPQQQKADELAASLQAVNISVTGASG